MANLAELGWERRAIDVIVRRCGVVSLPGYTRPVVRVRDYQEFINQCHYNGKDRVR